MPVASTSSGLKTASGVVSASPAVLLGVIAVGGSAVTTVIVYDNASAASGTILAKAVVPINQTAHVPLDIGVVALNGLYVSIAGAGGEAVVHYERA